MSGSSLYRLSTLAVAIAALSILHPIYELSMGEIQWHAVVFGAITVLGSGLILQQIQRLRENVDRARQVCEAVAAGDLEARITGIEEAGPLGDMLWSVNELVDRTDSFLR
ncbi:MAG: hypothetical protein K2Q10_06140, partial [Rhodospirillales bacterium]|nr:hypothetical protein [Rhodospirillales bacterium]